MGYDENASASRRATPGAGCPPERYSSLSSPRFTHDAASIPAILIRFSRYSVRTASDTRQRQEAQIVQSRLTLDDSLP